MKDLIKFVLIGALGGVLGGMGMGGGTVLIPLFAIFTEVNQKASQAINLISFIPMATIALIFHSRNGLVRKKNLLWVIIPACLFAVLGSVLCIFVNASVLRRVFGGFLILLSFLQFFSDKLTKTSKTKSGSK